MPTFEIDPTGRRRPKPLKQKGPEGRIQRLLLHNPQLLGHVNETERRRILWFWSRGNGPGDLFGVDEKGRFVVVELKKKLGKGEEGKAASQVRAAERLVRRFTIDHVKDKYARLREAYGLPGKSDFVEEFHHRTHHRLRLKAARPYLYVVAGHFTRRGLHAAHRKGRRRAKRIQIVVMYEMQLSGKGGRRVIVTTERG